MTATSKPPTTRRSPVLDPIGGPDLEVRHLPAEDRSAAHYLVHELRCVCNSLDRSGGPGGFVLNPHRSSWRCLRDVEEETIMHSIRKAERSFPGWRLRGSGDVFERVERFLMGASR
jgi:hypothetical protein